MIIRNIIDIANVMRPGNGFDNDLIERWIAECDASIQIEVALKKPWEVTRTRPPDWQRGKVYSAGDRVTKTDGGVVHVYEAITDAAPDAVPGEADVWKEVDYATFVGFPHDRLYYLYVIAMMSYAHGEYDKYDNDMKLYNAAYEEFSKWWQRVYRNEHREGDDKYEAIH